MCKKAKKIVADIVKNGAEVGGLGVSGCANTLASKYHDTADTFKDLLKEAKRVGAIKETPKGIVGVPSRAAAMAFSEASAE